MAHDPVNIHIRRGVTFGPVTITAFTSEGVPKPLAGWSAYAQVRKVPTGPLVLDLAPVILAGDTAGLITIPAIPYATTAGLIDGNYVWDMILQDGAGRRYEPEVSGAVVITTPTTQHA